MKKRIISLACAVAVVVTMLTVGIISSVAATPIKVDTNPISGAFDSTMWDPASKIESGNLKVTGGGKTTVNTVDNYNLGTDWEASIKIKYITSKNATGEPITLKVGDLSAVIYNCIYDKDANSVTTNGKVELINGTTVVDTYDLGAAFGTPDSCTTKLAGVMTLTYKNGTATVSLAGQTVITKAVSGLDFSDVGVTVSAKGNWMTNYIEEFALKSAPIGGASSEPVSSTPASSEPTSSAPVGAAKVESPISGALVPAMWNNDARITANGTVNLVAESVRTITTTDTYDLTDTWGAASKFGICKYWDNMVSTQVSGIKVGKLEVVVHNPQVQKTPAPATIIENAYIEVLVDGVQKKKVDVEIAGKNDETVALIVGYDNGTVTVGYVFAKNAITDSFTYDATADALDFSDVDISLKCTGCWQNDTVGIYDFALETADCVSSSEPTSSAPTSSAPTSSEPTSEPVSSEPEAGGEKVVAEISGALVAEMWQESDKITDGVAKITAGGSVTLNSVKKYNLGTQWEVAAGYTINGYWDQMNNTPSSIKLGDVEIVSVDGKIKNEGGVKSISEDGAVSLKIKGVEVQKVPVTYKKSAANLELRATYKDGIINVYYSIYGDEEVKAITYDATADALDFSEVPVVVYSKADWSNSCKIRTFALKTADTYVEPGAPIEVIKEAAFNAADWSGDTAQITAEGLFIAGTNTNSNRIITSNTAYNLSEGFKFSAKLAFKNSWTNYYGEYAAMWVGGGKNGIELRVKNITGQGLYTAALLINGEEVGTADLTNAPNGVYEMVYSDGKVSVILEGTPITWKLADESSTTSIAVSDVDLVKTNLGFRIAGNYSDPNARAWGNYSLAPVAADGSDVPGSTGDVRNIVIPAIAIVLGATAVAFVITRKKARA